MKLDFSFSKWADGFLGVVRGFPVTTVLTLFGVVCGLLVVGNPHNEMAVRVLLTAVLFFPVSIALQQMEKQSYPGWVKIGSHVLGLLLLVVHFLFFSRFDEFVRDDFTQYILWFGLAVVFLTISPFLRKSLRGSVDYWEYNKQVVYAILFAFAYSALVFIGLAVALGATNALFSLNWDGEVWLRLWILCVGLLSVPIFLSKLPDVSEVQQAEEFPKELRLLAGGVLLSLVCVYFVILYAYTFKILALNEWPKGVLASLIVGFSTIGLVTFVLLYPLSKLESRYRRIFIILFVSFIPQIIVLFYAVTLRLKDYGLTENRYLLISFGIWLGLVSLYFLFSKSKSLKVIPFSLIVFLLLASTGPVSAFRLSERDQVNRLKTLLISKHILVNNVLVKGPHSLSIEETGSIYSGLQYLNSYHGLDSISDFLPNDIRASNTHPCKRDERGCADLEQITTYIGVEYVPGGLESHYVSFNVLRDTPRVLDIKGFDRLVEDLGEVKVGSDTYTFTIDKSGYEYKVLKNNFVISNVALKDLIDKLQKSDYQKIQKGFTQEEMSITYSDGSIDMKIYFDYITLIDGRLEVKDLKLIKIK